MTTVIARRAFVGREVELDVLQRALAEARDARPAFIILDGAAGVGKTSLIERFLDANTELRSLHLSGDETEAMIPYAVVDQLLRQAGAADNPVLEATRGGSVFDPIGAGSRVLDALGAAQDGQPLVLVLDDCQWVDAQSLRALLFALRRLVADQVLTIIAVRTHDLGQLPEGLRRLGQREPGVSLTLQPFSADELLILASAVGITSFPHRAAQRLHEHTAGNPLHARALLSELPHDVWRGPLSLLPSPQSYEALVTAKRGQLPPQARDLLEAAAVLGLHADWISRRGLPAFQRAGTCFSRSTAFSTPI